ncbi:MAG TPA: hypothetical protein VF212_17525 [Longimicrobiales bacterium]
MRATHVALLAVGLVLWSRPAAGQTLFSWPDTTVDVAGYTTIEECDAAVRRSAETLEARDLVASGVWRDTIPFAPGEDTARVPAPVAATARTCGARFADADSVPLADFSLVMPLYLVAGWMDRAGTLVERRVAAVKPGADKELAAVLDTVVQFYLGRRTGGRLPVPPRLDLAEAAVTVYAPRIGDLVERVDLYFRVLQQAMAGGATDTAAVVRLGSLASAVIDSLDADERERLDEQFEVFRIEDFTKRYYELLSWMLGKEMFLDSLRKSTEAFVKVKRDTWVRATGQPPELTAFGMPLGERAPALEGGLLVGADSTVRRPVPGRVSLIVFLDHAACHRPTLDHVGYMYPRSCTGALYMLRRLEERFPTLDVTVISTAAGHFGYRKEGITPEREAEETKRWLESFGLRSAVYMVDAPHWRLPAPDGRRVAPVPPDIVTAYTFGKSWQVFGTGTAFLIDPDGVIIHSQWLARDNEREFAELIEILVARDGGRG